MTTTHAHPIDFSPSYIAFSESLLKANGELIAQWSQDSRNPELQESCQMIMDAAGAGQK